MTTIDNDNNIIRMDKVRDVVFTFKRSGETCTWLESMHEISPVLARKHKSATTKDGFTEEFDAHGCIIVDDDMYHPNAIRVLLAVVKGKKPIFDGMGTCQLLDAVHCADFFGLPHSSVQLVTAALLANISGSSKESFTFNANATPLKPPLLLNKLHISSATLKNLVLPVQSDDDDSILVEEVEVADAILENCTFGEAAAVSSFKVLNSSLQGVDLFAHVLASTIFSSVLSGCKLRTTGFLTIQDCNQINDTVFPEELVDAGSQCQLVMKNSSVVSDISLPFCYVTLEDVTFHGSAVIGQTKEKGRCFNFVQVKFQPVTFRESGAMSFDGVQFTGSVKFENGVHDQLEMKNMPNLAEIALPFHDISLDAVTFSGHVVLGKQDSRGRSFRFSRVTFGKSASFSESDAMSFEDVLFEDTVSFAVPPHPPFPPSPHSRDFPSSPSTRDAQSGQTEMDFCNVRTKQPIQLHDVTIIRFNNVEFAGASSFKNVTFTDAVKDCKFTAGTEFINCTFHHGFRCSTAVECSFSRCRMDTHFPPTWFSFPKFDQLITNCVFLKCTFTGCTFLHTTGTEASKYQESPYFTHKLHSNFSRSVLRACLVHDEQLTEQKARELCLYHAWNMHAVEICSNDSGAIPDRLTIE